MGMKTIVFILVLSLERTTTIPTVMALIPPLEEFPDLRNCRPESPCQYGNGDCGEAGDEGCEADLVCGVNNCGDFVGGMTGSCCAQLASTTYSRELNAGESAAAWTSWSPTWGGWGRQRVRVLTARDGTRSYQ